MGKADQQLISQTEEGLAFGRSPSQLLYFLGLITQKVLVKLEENGLKG